MTERDVRIESLKPMRVAAALGFGTSPEDEAWGKLFDWIWKQGLAAEIGQMRWFGFNSPGPDIGSPNYGYEQWCTVGPEAVGSGDVIIKECPGGRYAVVRCPFERLIETWKEFVAWPEDSTYQYADDHCLEELLTPWMMVARAAGEPVNMGDLRFDLWLPVLE